MIIKVIKTLLHKKTKNFKFLTSFSLDIIAWSTETKLNIALLLYSSILTHSAPLASLYNHWSSPFFDLSRGYRKRLVTWYGFKEPQKHPFADVLQKRCSKKFRNIERKTTELESLFNKVAGLGLQFIKKRLQRRCFPLNIAKFLRTAFFW